MDYKAWLSHTVSVASSRATKDRLSKYAAREDLSLAPLEDLLANGYTQVVWDAAKSKHGKCRELHNQKWLLQDFVSNLSHSAPIAERSHPNDTGCSIVVSGEGLPSVRVDYNGNVFDLEQ